MKKVNAARACCQRRAEWAAHRHGLRAEVSRILRDIERGHVNALDFARLNNFCMSSLMLLAKVEQPTWEAAGRDAELASLLRAEVEDDEGTEGAEE